MNIPPIHHAALRARVKDWDAARDRWAATALDDRDAVDTAKCDLIMAGAALVGYVEGLLVSYPEGGRSD